MQIHFQKLFDYEVDSDDEWEEEEPGESLRGSDDEKDKESEDEYEVDNEFMVPHGHLSDEEMVDEDEQMQDHTPETQKAKLKILQQEFVAEMKKKTEKLKPRLIGCVWVTSTDENGNAKRPESCAPVIWDLLFSRAMIYTDPIQFAQSKCDLASEEQQASASKSTQKRIDLNEHQIKDLVRLIHGSRLSRKFLATEFNAYCKQKDETSEGFPYVQAKIKQLATWQQCPEEGGMLNKLCWYVSPETREKYNLQELSLPNKWEYILNPNQTKSKAAAHKNITTEPNEGMLK
jgi:chromatin assembly factor 1 subunit A